MPITVGIDLGYKQHQFCVLAADGTCLDEFAVAHNGRAIDKAITRLLGHTHGDPTALAAGLEAPHGAVVDALLDHGVPVFSLNPKQLARFRDRYSASGAKDDRRDAFVLADSLRTDRARFRPVSSHDPAVVQLRELVRIDTELGVDLGRRTNRLRTVLHRYFVSILELCPAADEPWLWELLERAPTPQQASRLRRPTIQKLLKRNRIRRLDATQVRAALQERAVQAPAATVEAAAGHVTLLVAQLRLLHRQRRETQQQLQAALDAYHEEDDEENEHRDRDILLSVPGLGIRTAATMLSEAPELLRSRDYHTLRIRAGLAPVTRASGTSRVVCIRHACNKRLRNACYHWGQASLAVDPWARRYYERQRARGHRHARALRALADRNLQRLMAMLRDGTLYDPTRCQPVLERAKAA